MAERIRCSSCGKSVSTPVAPIGELVIRAWVECPECIGERAASGEREGVLNGSATPTTVTTESPGADPSGDVGEEDAIVSVLTHHEGKWDRYALEEAKELARRILARLRRTPEDTP